MMDSNGTYQVHSDHLGTPFMLTNSSKAVVWSAKKQAFGNTTVDEDPDANSSNISMNLRFPGQYYDTETQLHDNWHRSYNPNTGRYVQRDPIGLDAGVNTFAYVEGNPVGGMDVMGLWTVADKIPYPSPMLVPFLDCIQKCYKRSFVIVSTNEFTPVHPPWTGHAIGTSADIRYPSNPKKMLCCAGECGVPFALDEAINPSTNATGPHIHIQLIRKRTTRDVNGDIPDDGVPCEPCGDSK